MRNFKKFVLAGVMAVTVALSLTACSSSASSSDQQETTTVDAKAEQDSKRAAYREEQSKVAASKAVKEAESKAQEAAK